ncbi:unextended protein isoform X1 [Anopheles darlingi]|uniref:unextended protein isoform X1 n=1 Tax=Anopheles darlingi TaxID=43151 RepID=UPI0021003FD4|nr:unextended protein isoform X1 [Anopheles darlingi]
MARSVRDMARAIPPNSLKTDGLVCIMLKIILVCLLHLAVPIVPMATTHALPIGFSRVVTTSTVSSPELSTAIGRLATISVVPANDDDDGRTFRILNEELHDTGNQLAKWIVTGGQLECREHAGLPASTVVQSDNRRFLVELIPPQSNGHSPPERTKLLVLTGDAGGEPTGKKPEPSGPIDDLVCSSSWGTTVVIKFEPQRQQTRLKRSIDQNTSSSNSSNNAILRRTYGDGEKLGSPHILSWRVERSNKHLETEDDGVPSVHSNSPVVLRLFGTGITRDTVVIFTHEQQTVGGPCQVAATEKFRVMQAHESGRSGLVAVELPDATKSKYFYLCAKYEDTDPVAMAQQQFDDVKPFKHQGSDSWMRLTSYTPFLPLWVSLVIIAVCLVFSALFSGLNLGLMSLDRTDLKILCNTGTEQEKQYAKAIQPVRDHGNFLLCSILLGNVLVNSTFTILLDSLTSGLVAVICSTIAIVIFGEITPQAICSRHGLAVGAKTIVITKFVMCITFPLAYPTSKILDYLLGEEIGNFYNRERLKELVKVTNDMNDLDKDEVNVIAGVLELRKKTCSDVMTRLEDAFMLSYDTILDFETVTEIMKSGFSRIPVYEGDRQNIVALLYIKDLAFVDPDDNTPLKTVIEYYRNQCHFVFYDQTLDVMFKEFKEGHKGHMAFVHRVNSEGEGDPFYETIGLVTLEDVIEELIQAEIIDETDVYTDNRKKVRRERVKRQDFTVFAQSRDTNTARLRISPQLTLATFQYLTTTVDAFKSDHVSETILRRLLNQDIVHHIKFKGKEKNDPRISIITQGTPIDFFVLILEGRVEATVGKEKLIFESGPFTYFGVQALSQNVGYDISVDTPEQIMGSLQSLNRDASLRHIFIPDYTVKAVTEVVYVQISRNLYLAAKRATLMERSQRLGEQMEPLDAEVEKLLHSLDEDTHSITPDTTNLNVQGSVKASKTSSKAASPTLALNDVANNTNFNVPRNHTVLVHANSSSVAAANDTNIAPPSSGTGSSLGSTLMAGGRKSDADQSSIPLLKKQ